MWKGIYHIRVCCIIIFIKYILFSFILKKKKQMKIRQFFGIYKFNDLLLNNKCLRLLKKNCDGFYFIFDNT